jgi:RHS repeat-associated protein
LTANAGGVKESEVKYSAFGEIRDQSGATSTDYLYTGQRQEAELGLYYYVARWYDPVIGRFIQADTIIPDPASGKAYDRFGYVANNPLRYTDPTGHIISDSSIEDPAVAVSMYLSIGNKDRAAEIILTQKEDVMKDILVGIYSFENRQYPGTNNPDYVIEDFWTTDIHTSADGVGFILDWEKYRSDAYDDGSGNPTKGWGHLCEGRDCSPFSDYSFWDLFKEDLSNSEAGVRSGIQQLDNKYFGNVNGYSLGSVVTIDQSMFDALTDLSFNVGPTAVSGWIQNNLVTGASPTYDKTAFEVDLGDYGGTESRRLQRVQMFFDNDYDSSH